MFSLVFLGYCNCLGTCIWQSAKVPGFGSQSPNTLSIIKIAGRLGLLHLPFSYLHDQPAPRHDARRLRCPTSCPRPCPPIRPMSVDPSRAPSARPIRLAHHAQQVRAVVAPTDGLVLSASRDATAITWTRPDANTPFVQAAVLRSSPRYVNAIAYIPPSPDAPEGERLSHIWVSWA